MRHALVIAALCAAGLASRPVLADGSGAHASLKGPNGEDMGTVKLTEGPNGVLIVADVKGLTPGPHAIHIHQKGKCQPDFAAAGEHFQPDHKAHGFLSADGYHAGDLPDIHADQSGGAKADFFSTRISLKDGAPGNILDEDGSAIIVHEKADSYAADPGAGGRVACGVIERD